jgi:hypothetical protein
VTPKKQKLPDQFQDDSPKEPHNYIPYDETEQHKCSVCKKYKELLVDNKYTQICGECYCEESTRLAKDYYDWLKAQEELRLNIRKTINEQNNHPRRMESKES